MTTTIPTTIAFSDTPSEGISPRPAKVDHRHGAAADPVTAHAAAADPHTGYVLESLLDAAGDLLYATADNTPARLAIGAAFQILRTNSGATAPEWAGGLSLITDTVLGSDTASVSFSSIPGTYKHLVLWVQSRGDGAVVTETIPVRFNSDSGANYDLEVLYANDTTVAGASVNGAISMQLGLQPGTSVARANLAGGNVILVPNYAGTTFEKGAFGFGGQADSTAANCYVHVRWGAWRNTAAVTAITLLPATSTNFKTGSRFTLYGVS